MKKLLVLVVGIAMLSPALFASGGSQGSAQGTASSAVAGTADSPGWKLNASKPVKFQWYINFSWFSRQWGQSKVSKYITQKTGVDVEFIVPAGNEAERLNAMIAGNTLPDLITLGWWEGQVGLMIDAGLVEPLNVLAEQYDPYFFKVADKNKLGWYTRNDGNVYGYPNASYTSADYEKYKGKLTANETFLVRKDMWEALGKPDMSTPEGFLAALRAAKEKFPTINGQSIIPLSFQEFGDTGNTALQAYLLHFLNIKPEKNGKYESFDLGLDDPEYVRWLKTFRQAAQEGLIPMDVFVDKRSQIEEKAAQGRYFCMMYQNWDMQAPQNALYARDPNMIYIAIDGPKNTRSDPPALAGGGISGWTITLISKNCKDKARAIQFLSYLISEEGQMDTFFGISGDTYTVVNGVPTFTPAVKEVNLTDKNKQEIEIGVDYTYWMLMDTAWQGQWPVEYAPSLGQPQLWTRPYVTSYAQYDNLEMQPGSDAALIFDEIQRRWGRDLPRLILAKTEAEFDSIWNDFQKFKTDRGYAKLQEEQTKLLVANKRKLGIQ
ncbi:MAG: extracellular solute-binding protein [Treponema sp.]|jgi:putative aldouronate transport system substrate-binding protein|nr:extracellular solute-binding protein [Treponema sp.]